MNIIQHKSLSLALLETEFEINLLCIKHIVNINKMLLLACTWSENIYNVNVTS